MTTRPRSIRHYLCTLVLISLALPCFALIGSVIPGPPPVAVAKAKGPNDTTYHHDTIYIVAGQSVSFRAKGNTTDPGYPWSYDNDYKSDPETVPDTIAIRWYVQKDGGTWTSIGTSETISYTFSSVGVYSVRLEVDDTAGRKNDKNGDGTPIVASDSITVYAGGITISNLTGNVAGSNISGTNLTLDASVKDLKPSTDFNVSVRLGNNELASNDLYMKLSAPSPAGATKIRTDASGNWTGKVRFSSVNLADGSSGALKVRAVEAYTVDSNSAGTYTLYNKGYVLGNGTSTQDGVALAGQVNTLVAAINHTTSSNTTEHKPTITTNLPTYTIFYICTHGAYNFPNWPNETEFRDCDSSPGDDPPTHCLPSSQVSTSVGGKSSTQPAYNFVYVDDCEGSAHSDMAGAFGLTGVNDRGYLSWDDEALDNQTRIDWGSTFMCYFGGGYTLGESIAQTDALYTPPGTHGTYGDTATTINYVYGGAF